MFQKKNKKCLKELSSKKKTAYEEWMRKTLITKKFVENYSKVNSLLMKI